MAFSYGGITRIRFEGFVSPVPARAQDPQRKAGDYNRVPMNIEQARTNMVEQQIRTWEVLDQDVLDLLYVVPREEFVPPKHRALAFSDMQLPIDRNQRMWEPKLEARILQELAVHKTDRVLEVGTGSGYLTALLAHRAAHVVSVEIEPALATFGRENLERHGANNVTLETGDASHGWPSHAPYQVIVLTGSTPVLPHAFLEQLEVGGRLFAIVGELPIMTARLITCSAPQAYQTIDLFETVVVPLVNCEHPARFRF
jgi:protein-L-isoaspartate(D-aspartate) O-methyltransferase